MYLFVEHFLYFSYNFTESDRNYDVEKLGASGKEKKKVVRD